MTKVRIKNPEKPSMAKAIRAKCLDCSMGQEAEVRQCVITRCPYFRIVLVAILQSTLKETPIQ